MTAVIVIAAVALALIGGAAWGLFGSLPSRVEGFIVALAGGALTISAVLELVESGIETAGIGLILLSAFMGAITFSLIGYLSSRYFGKQSGTGLLAAITLDGIPENLALGVSLIGSGPLQVMALAASIFLSNLPEAAGGARQMREAGRSRGRCMLIWTVTAGILSAAAIVGYVFLLDTDKAIVACIKAFAGGAVISSLSTEVFPEAFREDEYLAGIATVVGFCLALLLVHIGNQAG